MTKLSIVIFYMYDFYYHIILNKGNLNEISNKELIGIK